MNRPVCEDKGFQKFTLLRLEKPAGKEYCDVFKCICRDAVSVYNEQCFQCYQKLQETGK